MNRFPTNLKHIKYEVMEHARNFGLDFFDIIFEVVDWREMNEIASYGGFPTRYPHWSFGMEYERMSKGYAYGLQRIYEMVINNNPCYAYLLESNNIVDQKLVMAHCAGHSHYFKNNVYFKHTNRHMLDEIANHGNRIRRYVERYGREEVETFLDACLSIEDLIDWHASIIKRKDPVHAEEDTEEDAAPRLKSNEYMDTFINPPDVMKKEKEKVKKKKERKKKIPESPEKDILLFLIEHADMENWKRDILSMIREEAYYFAPQGQTKIGNEGFAVYVHSRLMTNNIAGDSDIVDYADHHAGVVAAHEGQLNPYRLGYLLLLDIEERWNKGRFGKDYEACDDWLTKKKWDTGTGIGKEKVFEVVQMYNDVMLIDTFLTPEFCFEHKLFVFAYDSADNWWKIASKQFEEIKRQILFSLTNFGRPFIYVLDGDFEGRKELYLKHEYEGLDLKMDETLATLRNVYAIWKRPVHLESQSEGKKMVLTYNGVEWKSVKG